MRKALAAALGGVRTVLGVRGADAAQFLQGYATVHVLKHRHTGAYGAMLNAQGRILADVFLYPETTLAGQPCLLLDCDRAVAPAIVKHLTMYRLRTKVTFSDESTQFQPWAVWSPDVPEAPPVEDDAPPPLAVVDARCPVPARRQLLPPGETPADARQVPPEDWLVHRICQGVPEGPDDFRASKSFPFECNLDYMRGVHFDKGCYLGQEPTARTFFRGATRKRVVPVQFYSSAPPTDAPRQVVTVDPAAGVSTPTPGTVLLDLAGQPVGTVGSAIHNVGLALVRLPPPDLMTVAGADGGPVLCARAFPPPWWETRGTGK
eukprot:EG_transcript_18250